jgi:hypothetical protein
MKHRSLLIPLVAPLLMLSWGLASLGQAPSGLKGTIVVLNKSGHDASFIDLASGSIVATLPTGRGPHELVITRDGRRLQWRKQPHRFRYLDTRGGSHD